MPVRADRFGGRSSVGRATALQAVGRRFEPDRLHHFSILVAKRFGLVAQLVRARA